MLWDAQTGDRIAPLKGGNVNTAAFSPDGTRILTTGGDFLTTVLTLWDAQTGTSLFTTEHDVVFTEQDGDTDTIYSAEVAAIVEELYDIACTIMRYQPESEQVRKDCEPYAKPDGSE